MISNQEPQCNICSMKAKRVCCSLKCIKYPFFCDGLCFAEKNLWQIIHIHQKNQIQELLSLDDMDKLIQYIFADKIPEIVQTASIQIQNLKILLDDLFLSFRQIVIQACKLKITQEANAIISKLKDIKNNQKNIRGQEIGILKNNYKVFEDYQSIQNQKQVFQKQFQKMTEGVKSSISDLLLKMKRQPSEKQILISESEQDSNPIVKAQYQQLPQELKQKQYKNLDLAKQAESLGNFQKAILYYQKIVKTDLYNSNIQCQIAKCAVKLKRFTLASKKFNQAIKNDPHNFQAYYQYGLMYIIKQNYLKSIENFLKSKDLDSNNYLHYYQLGVCYNKVKKYKQAFENLSRAIKLQNESGGCYYQIGLSLFKLQKYQQSLQYLNKAININPNLQQYYLLRGMVNKKLNKCSQAELDFAMNQQISKRVSKPIIELQKKKERKKDNQIN